MKQCRLIVVLLLAGGLQIAAAHAFPAPEDARPARAASRCLKLMDLIACGDALNRQPNSPELLVAEADTLVRLKRPGEAIGVYRNALTVGANPSVLQPRIRGARSLRHSLLQTCLVKQGVIAEQACEAAWLPGAPDEVAVFKRRGSLLQSNGDAAAALDAYMAAARLAPKDLAVARAIVALATAAGRRDQPTLSVLATAKDRLRTAERPAIQQPPGAAMHHPAPLVRAIPGAATRGAAAGGAAMPGAAMPAVNAPAAAARAPTVPLDAYTNMAEVTRSN